MNKLFHFFVVVTLCSCVNNSKIEKYQDKRENITNVEKKITEIDIKDVFIGSLVRVYMIDDYLIIKDIQSTTGIVNIFDKHTFQHMISAVSRGRGPREIINVGYMGIDEVNREFYLSDHGKQRIFKYHLDSLLTDPLYMPKVKIKMNEKKFLTNYQYINDTLSIGIIVEVIGTDNFTQWIAKWNMNTGEIKPMKYHHPDILKKRFTFAVSTKDSIYVECNINHDLITICSFDGDLKYNIYGPNWSNAETKMDHFGKVLFCNDKIVALYSGGNAFVSSKNRGLHSAFPTKFIVFDTNGDYIKTLETGYNITDFCFDKENNRIIMNLEDTIQFAYLDLDGLID